MLLTNKRKMIKYISEVISLFITIILSDFDGTLNEYSDANIFASNLDAINQWREKGLPFVITTGRSPESLRAIFPNYANYVDYCIFNDGALITDRYDRVLFSDSFGQTLADAIEEILSNFKHSSEYAKICFNEFSESPAISPETEKIRFWFNDLTDCIALEKMLQDKLQNELELYAYHRVLFNDDTRLHWVKPTMRYILEVNRKGTDKKTGADKLIEALGIKGNAYVITVGDDINDISMLKAYHGYIVRNAREEVRKNFNESRIVDHLYNLIMRKLPR